MLLTTLWNYSLEILLVLLLGITFGFAFGRRTGRSEGLANGKAEDRIQLRTLANELGYCPICNAVTDSNAPCGQPDKIC